MVVGLGGWLGLIIMSNLNRVRLSCCWVGVGLGCDNLYLTSKLYESEIVTSILNNSASMHHG